MLDIILQKPILNYFSFYGHFVCRTQIFAFTIFKNLFLSLKVIQYNSFFCLRPQFKPLLFQLILALDHSGRAMPSPAHFSLRPLRSGHLSGSFFFKTTQVGLSLPSHFYSSFFQLKTTQVGPLLLRPFLVYTYQVGPKKDSKP